MIQDDKTEPRMTRVSWAWPRVAWATAVGAAFLVLARWTWLHDQALIGAILGVVGLTALVVGARSRRAECPGDECPCTLFFEGRFVRCPCCAEYFQRDGRGLAPVSEQYVADEAVFRIGPSDLDTDEPILPWNGGCCMCGEEVARKVSVYVERASGQSDNTRISIPACEAHGDGVRPDPGRGLGVNFRSYAYWKEFVGLNRGTEAAQAVAEAGDS